MRQHGDQLQVEVRVDDRAVDVRVTGEIDIATVAQFRSVLWAQPPRPLLRLDLSGVSVFSATAIRTLVAAHLGVRARGGELVLVDPHPMIIRVLRGTGLHRVIPIQSGSTPRVTLPPERPLTEVATPQGVVTAPATRITLPAERPVTDAGAWAGSAWHRPGTLAGVPRVGLPTRPAQPTAGVAPRRFVAV
ncbi:anti-sigma factor antagonist [Micromonospora cathayae]|uniref:Anti-sigma factor antagonist n=1 Tax=Micromonospora cathayae TaxID=3028804 RepID=A0ABY7ZJ67_9ACTN|nr:anti-sigma factor antagonist [Micromonospora sp. HUAS 3]WDZ83032.1 anti-sigma factor antagonist [Micromonospora sp. HUAS 3]